MVSNYDFAPIEALDFEAIKAKLMHRGKGGEGWSQARVNAVELEYRRFLYLTKKFPTERTAPLVEVDTFWHYHILDTVKYAADCQQVFGYFLHHFPYAGMRGKEDEQALERMGKRMRTLYEETFSEPYASNFAADGERPRTAMSSGIQLRAAYGAQLSYSVRDSAKTAYCFSTTAESAYCFATTEQLAYCFTARNQAEGGPAAATALRPVQAAEIAYCFTPEDKAFKLSTSRVPEERTGFYLERPRLPLA
jgi:hypothetical protein